MSRAPLKLGAIALGLAYLAYGVLGIRASLAFVHGRRLAARGDYAGALPLLDRGAFGGDASESAWLAGDVLLGLADWEPDPARRAADLQGAVDRYVRMLRLDPGSSFALAGLGGAYDRVERAERRARVTDLAALSAGPWAAVGHDGRIAIGALRLAVAREPMFTRAHDDLLNVLVGYGLIEEAKAAARAAALETPMLRHHPGLAPDKLPREVVEAFAEGARAALDAAPLLSRERKLFGLAMLEEILGRPEQALADLRIAHAAPSSDLERAETAYHTARLLVALGRGDEAGPSWTEAERAAVFRAPVAVDRARLAESRGRLDETRALLARARTLDPKRLDLILWEARLQQSAGDARAAIDTLRWGVLTHPDAREPRLALIEALLAARDRGGANEALRDLERSLGPGDDSRALRAKLDAPP